MRFIEKVGVVFLIFVAIVIIVGAVLPAPTPEQVEARRQQDQAAWQARVKVATVACAVHIGMLPGDRPVSVDQIGALDLCMRVWFAEQGVPYPH